MNASNGRPSQHLGMNGETYSGEVPWMNASNGKIFTASEHVQHGWSLRHPSMNGETYSDEG